MANIQLDTAHEELDSDEEDNDYIPSEDESENEVVSDDEKGAETSESPCKVTKRKRKADSDYATSNTKASDVHFGGENAAPDEESKKKRAETLWANFLGDVGPLKKKDSYKHGPRMENVTKKTTVTQIFHFAGEEVKVQREEDVEKKGVGKAGMVSPSKDESNEALSCQVGSSTNSSRPHCSGLGTILGKIARPNNKISTLEKSKLDWNQFKSENQLSEVLEQHNRGKDGYLEKQAFLQRTDLRQFEHERQLRLKSRHARNF